MHGEDGGIKEKMRAWKRIWKALLCSLLFYSRKNMKYDGAIVEYSKLETFYMVNFDLFALGTVYKFKKSAQKPHIIGENEYIYKLMNKNQQMYFRCESFTFVSFTSA